MEDDAIHVGPSFNLPSPLLNGAHGCDDQERTTIALLLEEVVQDTDALDGFAQTHFVGEDRVAALEPTEYQPPHTDFLVVPQFVAIFEFGEIHILIKVALVGSLQQGRFKAGVKIGRERKIDYTLGTTRSAGRGIFSLERKSSIAEPNFSEMSSSFSQVLSS